MIPKKAFFITVSLSAMVVFAATTSMRSDPETPQWKNLKVLPKNISKDDLDKVMDDWKAALGVKCGFCHARDAQTNKTDFASDAKPEKNMAREMMEMTAKINKKYFKPEPGEGDKGKDDHEMLAAVSCYTCHHGSAHPDAGKGLGGDHDHERRGPQPAPAQPGNMPATPPPSN